MKYLLLCFLLVGCSSSPKITVPIAVSCVSTIPQAPALKYAPGTYTDVFSIVRDLKGDRELMLGYQGELEAVIQGCK